MPAVAQTIGRLTRGECNIPGMIRAKCSCGYPVLLDAVDWGHVLGCSKCHDLECEAREQIEIEEKKKREQEKRAKREREHYLTQYIRPDFSELDENEISWVRRLYEIGWFNVKDVFYTLLGGASTGGSANLKDEVLADSIRFLHLLAGANILVERNYMGEVKQYGPAAFYNITPKNPQNSYSIRRVAMQVLDLEKINREKARELRLARQAERELARANANPCVTDPMLALLENFIEARCSLGENFIESEMMLKVRMDAWLEARSEESVEVALLWALFDAAGYKRTKQDLPLGEGRRRGLKLNTVK
jgi:hypothetical protein